jgi:two-component system phosphate regulon sensor histidine kinase PhoR
MTEGVIVLDKAGRIVSLNPTIEKIFGVDKKETENRLFLEAIRNNDLFEIIDVSLKKGRLVSRELTLVWPVQKIFEVNAAPIFEKGEVTGSLVVIHDITEIRKLETVRRDFVANVSHELKTPLTSIKGFVETLLEGAMDDKENSRQFLRIVQDHAERLNNLINDLLDLSSIESEKITLKKEDFDIGKLFEEVISGFRAQIKKKKIEIRNKLTSPLVMHADRNRIEQVMTNLLDNSIKFNKEDGFIKIYADDSEGQIKIFVEDSGIGIPAKDIPRIFERFYRVDKARSRELGGTGLGLSIVKHITELHGGSVGVESMEGSGAKFWFTIPKGA